MVQYIIRKHCIVVTSSSALRKVPSQRSDQQHTGDVELVEIFINLKQSTEIKSESLRIAPMAVHALGLLHHSCFIDYAVCAMSRWRNTRKLWLYCVLAWTTLTLQNKMCVQSPQHHS